MAIMDVCGGGLIACLITGELIELYEYTEVQGNRQNGSVELNKETTVQARHNCKLRTAKLT